VEQAANPDHRRASLVRLSPAGQALMAELAARQAVLADRFTPGGGLGAAELEAAATLLRRMREASEVGLGED
jgi:DNA-binding MarR family transcriptional regulator